METPATGLEIAARELRIGLAVLLPGDKFDTPRYLKRGVLRERIVDTMRGMKQILPLTPENYADMMRRRPNDDAVGAGFTTAFLVESGIIASDEAPEPKAAEKVEVQADAIPYGGQLIQPKKVGRFTYFEVLNTQGELLRASMFRKLEKAQEFIDGLAGSTDSTGAGKADAEEEPEANGEHLQSGAD